MTSPPGAPADVPPRWVSRLPAYAGAAATVVGLVMLYGWARHFETAGRLGPLLPTMKANSSLGCVFAGLALAVRGPLGRCLAVVPFAIGTATLVEHMLDVSLGIDQLLVHDTFTTDDPGRPTLQAALALAIVGASRMLSGSRHRRVDDAGALLAAVFLCLAGFLELAWIFQAPELLAHDGNAGLSLASALSTGLLAMASTARHAGRRPLVRLWDRGLTGTVARRFLPPVIIAPPALALLRELGQRWDWFGLELGATAFVGSMILLLAVIVTATTESVHRLEADSNRIRHELQAIFESVPGSLTMRDPGGRLVHYDRTGEAPLTYQGPLLAYLGELTAQEAEARSSGHAITREYGPTADGREYEITAFPVLDLDGSLLGIGGYGIDITDRRRTERALREAEQRARHLADHDPLTAIWNRRRFERELGAVLDSFGDGRVVDGALMIVDVDHFKAVNDGAGHPAGDRLLIAVAHHLGEVVRDVGAVSRLGGDEFAVMVCHLDRQQIEAVAAAVVEAVAAAGRASDLGPLAVTGSVGVADFADLSPAERTTSDALRRADEALYVAKHRGRGQYVVYDEHLAHTG